ncbi:MAG: S41 family peptidase [Pseudomonadota bacterium]
MKILKYLGGLLGLIALGAGISFVVSAPNATMRGIWATEGYGLYLDIGRTQIDIYEVTEISCLHSETLPAHQWLINALEEVTFATTGDQLQINVASILNPIIANRQATLPALCPQTPDEPGTAQENFDVLWQVMDEHYAFFELHGVDWDARQSLRPATHAVLSDEDLFSLFQETLAGLDDGHLSISGPDGQVHSPSVPPDWHDERYVVRNATFAQFDQLTEIPDTGLQYGWATPDIGYIHIAGMHVDPGFNTGSIAFARDAFSEAATALENAKGIIVDVRYNPGGSDQVALAYAGFFTDTPRPALSKTIRTASGYTEPLNIVLTPQGDMHLDQPVVLLTTKYTGSAAEIFTIAMRELGQVTVMGTNTSGGLSDIGNFRLPNGWELGLSHQRYLSADGTLFEGSGVPPDITMQVELEAARTGQDTQLQAAIGALTDG